MKHSITKKIFTLIVTSISIFSMGCGDDKNKTEVIEEYNMRIYQPQLKIILTGMDADADGTIDAIENGLGLPKIRLAINGDVQLVPLEAEKFTFSIELQEGDLYGITMEQESDIQFVNQDLNSDSEFADAYNINCDLHDASGTAGDEMDDALLICNISFLPPPDVIIEG